MSNITEHDTKQEWENWNCIKGWVYLLISWHTVSVDDFLEWCGECIGLNMGWTFSLWLHLSKWYKWWENLIQQTSLLLFNPNFTNHNVVGFLQQVHSVEDQRLLFKKNSKCFKSCTTKFFAFDGRVKIFSKTFFSHGPELFSISNAIFNLFDFIKDLIFVGRKSVFFSIETFADSIDFIYQDVTRFNNNDKSWSWNGISISLWGCIESIKDRVSLWCSKDHFGEFMQIFSMDDSWNIDKLELWETGLIEVNFLLISSLSTKNLSCLK